MTINDRAKEYLDYYLSQSGPPEFAVLLEGPWGSGKSHFVTEYFKQRHKAAQAKDVKAEDNLIHVTLFGVRELSDITTQIFEKAHPLLGGKAAKLFNFFGSKIGGIFGASLEPSENTSLLQDMVLDLTGKILVFDDLERCPLPIVEAMGYINGYVEHQKVHVIVVASEGDIDRKQRAEYDQRKEKLIGKTIRVGSDPEEVLETFQTRLKLTEAVNAVKVHRKSLLATFEAFGENNFRSLRAVLLDFERIATLTDERLRASPKGMGDLLLYMTAIGMEFRSASLDATKLAALQSSLRFTTRASTDQETQASAIRTRYRLVSWNDPIVQPTHLAEMFTSGSFDIEAVNVHIARHPTIVGREATPTWRLMWAWYDLSQTEYADARSTLARQISEREITHPGELLHAFGTMLRLRGLGDDLFDGAKPKKFVADYLSEIEDKDVLSSAPELFGLSSGSFAGLVYNESDTNDFKQIHALVEAAATRALDRRLAREATDLLAALRTEPPNGAALYEWGLNERKYAGYAILHHLDVRQFADILIVDSKVNDQILASLRQRYKIGANERLNSERIWLSALRSELEARVANLPAPFKKWNGSRIAYAFNDIDKELPGPPTRPPAKGGRKTRKAK